LDDKIECNRRMNRTLEAMARAIFRSWFVDFDPVRAKIDGRAPAGMDAATAALFPEHFEDSDLGKIPVGWKVSEIRELTSAIQYGLTQSAKQKPIGPHFLRITDIRGGNIDWSQVPYCSVSETDFPKYRVLPGDVFVARTGASTGENVYIVDCPKAVFASYLVRFKFPHESLARYTGEYMRTADYFTFVSGIIGGSAQPNANAQQLASAKLVIPPHAICNSFYQTVQPLDQKKYANEVVSLTLAALRDALLPKLMSGELRVPEAEQVVGRAT
jgi:type I restriction enzyme S subunit